MKNLQNLAKNLRKIRLEKELSQENVAFELGISREAYRKLENGKTKLNITHLEGLSNVFKMDLIEILNYDTEKYNIIRPKYNVSVVNNGTVEHHDMAEKQQTFIQHLITHNEQLLAHNQQLIAENRELKQGLNNP